MERNIFTIILLQHHKMVDLAQCHKINILEQVKVVIMHQVLEQIYLAGPLVVLLVEVEHSRVQTLVGINIVNPVILKPVPQIVATQRQVGQDVAQVVEVELKLIHIT
jgi:hypothetical protein